MDKSYRFTTGFQQAIYDIVGECKSLSLCKSFAHTDRDNPPESHLAKTVCVDVHLWVVLDCVAAGDALMQL